MPALNDVLAGSIAQGFQLQQVQGALLGVPQKAIPISLTALNDATHYALTVQNLEPTNSRALLVLKSDGSTLIQADATNVTTAPLHVVGGITATQITTTASLGGDLTGTLPNPTVALGAITSAKMAAGAAATNVGTLGGDLSGTLPNPTVASGAITAAKLATSGKLHLLGSYFNTPTFTTSTTGAWVLTPVVASVTIAGNKTMAVEFTVPIYSNGSNLIQLALGFDGTPSWPLAMINTSAASQTHTLSSKMILAPGSFGAGSHTAQIFVQAGGGTTTINTTDYSQLYVTEWND